MATQTAASRALLKQALRLELYRRDFETFAGDQLKIATKAEGLRPFRLHPFQARLNAAIDRQLAKTGKVRQIQLKSRQIGTSTLAQGRSFHRVVLNPYVKAIVVAQDVGTAQDIFMMARRFYDHLDPGLQPMVRYSTRTELLFDNPSDDDRSRNPGLNSKLVISTARNISSGRGGTYQVVHLTEAAWYQNPAEIERATLQTVPNAPGTMVIIESTPSMIGTWFRQMYERAKKGQSAYEAHFIGWTDDPSCWIPLEPGDSLEPYSEEERDLIVRLHATPEQLKWRRHKLDEMRGDEDGFRQEYPSSEDEGWLQRDWMVFPAPQVSMLRAGLAAPLFRAEVLPRGKILQAVDGPFAVWEVPGTGELYDVGADPALGIAAGDWSACVVVKRRTGEQVAEYRAKLEPGEFADVIASIGWYYHTAQVVPEANSIGLYTVAELFNRVAYPNVFLQRKIDRVDQAITKFGGFYTTQSTKKLLVSHAKDRVFRWTKGPRTRPLIRSEELWQEIRAYVQEPGAEVYHGAPGSHDDLVQAWLLALFAAYDEPAMDLPPDRPAQTTDEIAATRWLSHPSRTMTAAEARVPVAAGWLGDFTPWEAA